MHIVSWMNRRGSVKKTHSSCILGNLHRFRCIICTRCPSRSQSRCHCPDFESNLGSNFDFNFYIQYWYIHIYIFLYFYQYNIECNLNWGVIRSDFWTFRACFRAAENFASNSFDQVFLGCQSVRNLDFPNFRPLVTPTLLNEEYLPFVLSDSYIFLTVATDN